MTLRNAWIIFVGATAGAALTGIGPSFAADYSALGALHPSNQAKLVDCDTCMNAPLFTPENSKPQSDDNNGSQDSGSPGETAGAPLFTPESARPDAPENNGTTAAAPDNNATGNSLFGPDNAGGKSSGDNNNPFESAIQPPHQ